MLAARCSLAGLLLPSPLPFFWWLLGPDGRGVRRYDRHCFSPLFFSPPSSLPLPFFRHYSHWSPLRNATKEDSPPLRSKQPPFPFFLFFFFFFPLFVPLPPSANWVRSRKRKERRGDATVSPPPIFPFPSPLFSFCTSRALEVKQKYCFYSWRDVPFPFSFFFLSTAIV